MSKLKRTSLFKVDVLTGKDQEKVAYKKIPELRATETSGKLKEKEESLKTKS